MLTEKDRSDEVAVPDKAILVAKNIGPGDLLAYGKSLKGIVLEEGSVGSHATIIARAWAIPMVLHAEHVTHEAVNGDTILVDGDQGLVHLRPDDTIEAAFKDKIAMVAEAQQEYAAIRGLPATTKDGIKISMQMNGGVDGRPSKPDSIGCRRCWSLSNRAPVSGQGYLAQARRTRRSLQPNHEFRPGSAGDIPDCRHWFRQGSALRGSR